MPEHHDASGRHGRRGFLGVRVPQAQAAGEESRAGEPLGNGNHPFGVRLDGLQTLEEVFDGVLPLVHRFLSCRAG